jgi:REP element-mobilizing transposase RayT
MAQASACAIIKIKTTIKMSRKYKIHDQSYPYFITSTVVNWIDVFTRPQYRDVVINSLRYSRKEKGLLIYAYCIMTNHIHLMVGTKDEEIQNIIRDFKSYTSNQIRKKLEENIGESRKKWMLEMMYKAGREKSNNKDFQFWQHSYHPIQLDSNELIDQKLQYIHMNPVKAGFVNKPEDYLYSSAKNYADEQAVLEIDCWA